MLVMFWHEMKMTFTSCRSSYVPSCGTHICSLPSRSIDFCPAVRPRLWPQLILAWRTEAVSLCVRPTPLFHCSSTCWLMLLRFCGGMVLVSDVRGVWWYNPQPPPMELWAGFNTHFQGSCYKAGFIHPGFCSLIWLRVIKLRCCFLETLNNSWGK